MLKPLPHPSSFDALHGVTFWKTVMPSVSTKTRRLAPYTVSCGFLILNNLTFMVRKKVGQQK